MTFWNRFAEDFAVLFTALFLSLSSCVPAMAQEADDEQSGFVFQAHYCDDQQILCTYMIGQSVIPLDECMARGRGLENQLKVIANQGIKMAVAEWSCLPAEPDIEDTV